MLAEYTRSWPGSSTPFTLNASPVTKPSSSAYVGAPSLSKPVSIMLMVVCMVSRVKSMVTVSTGLPDFSALS